MFSIERSDPKKREIRPSHSAKMVVVQTNKILEEKSVWREKRVGFVKS